VHLSAYAGQVRLVDFWATWCAPCREEVPMFKDLHAQYGPRGFALLAISLDEDEEGREAVRTFVREHGIPYANLIADDEVEKAFGPIVGVPMAFLVDREGRIVETWVGAKPREVLERRIQDLLGAG
jgi:thiol-disulfide isomerase/thioredoxin